MHDVDLDIHLRTQHDPASPQVPRVLNDGELSAGEPDQIDEASDRQAVRRTIVYEKTGIRAETMTQVGAGQGQTTAEVRRMIAL